MCRIPPTESWPGSDIKIEGGLRPQNHGQVPTSKFRADSDHRIMVRFGTLRSDSDLKSKARFGLKIMGRFGKDM